MLQDILRVSNYADAWYLMNAPQCSTMFHSLRCACREQASLLETFIVIVMDCADRGDLANALRSERLPSY